MPTRTDPIEEPRVPLSKERVLRAAIRLADQRGLESLSMRKLAQELGVEAMSLYNHVANKDDILNGIVDVVVSEIEMDSEAADWKTAMRRRAISAREVMARHPWAPGLITSRPNISSVMLRYMDSAVGILRKGGLSVELAHHAMHAIGSRVFGFTQELFDSDDVGPEMAATFLRQIPADQYPFITEMLMEIKHDDEVEFRFGLDLVLDGLESLRESE